MESQVLENRYYIECSCNDYNHLFTFDYDKEFEFIQIGFQYRKLDFWNRLKFCFNYLFKKENLYIEEILIDKNHIQQLEELISEIKKERKGK